MHAVTLSMTWISKQLYQDGMGVFSRLRLFCLLHASKLYRWQCQSWSVCCGWAIFDHAARNQGQILDPHINNSCTSAIASCNPRRSCMSLLGNCNGLLLSDSLPHLVITSIHSLFFLCMWVVSWGVASLPEGKSWGLHLVQLCAKYRQGKLHRILSVER